MLYITREEILCQSCPSFWRTAAEKRFFGNSAPPLQPPEINVAFNPGRWGGQQICSRSREMKALKTHHNACWGTQPNLLRSLQAADQRAWRLSDRYGGRGWERRKASHVCQINRTEPRLRFNEASELTQPSRKGGDRRGGPDRD